MFLFGYRYYTAINTAFINKKYGNTGPNISTGTVSPSASSRDTLRSKAETTPFC